MLNAKITTIALDLEGTLISNAMSQIPRPGLRAFLDRCHALFARIVIYTAISEARFRDIAATLVREDYAPGWFADIEFIPWDRTTKDLRRVSGAELGEILLVDDLREYVHPGQEANWVPVPQFAAPYPENDAELAAVLELLETRAGA